MDEVVRGTAQPAGVIRAGDHLRRGPGALVEVEPPQPDRAGERDDERRYAGRGDRLHVGQGRPDDDDRLTQRDQDERLAALGEVAALDGPVRGAGPAEARGGEADHPAEQVDADRAEPQQGPGVAVGQPAGQGERAADHAPGQDPLEVGLQRMPAQHDDHEHGAADLLDGVGPADPQAQVLERARQRRRHGQADQHEHHEQQAHRHELRVEPVGDPGGVRPDQPHHGQQQPGLQRAGHGGVADQVVRQLGDREHVHQVEEQLDVGDPLRAGTVTQQPGGNRISRGRGTSGTRFGQVTHENPYQA